MQTKMLAFRMMPNGGSGNVVEFCSRFQQMFPRSFANTLDPVCTAVAAAALESVDSVDDANRTIYGAIVWLHAAHKLVDFTLMAGAAK